jgi:hypothetical protein
MATPAKQKSDDLDLALPANTPKMDDLAPASDRRQLAKITPYAQPNGITSDEECAEASEALTWLAERRKAIEKNPAMVRLIGKVQGVLDELKAVVDGAVAKYRGLEAPLRVEIGRFQTARERERLRLEREANERQRVTQKALPPKPTEVKTKTGDTFTFAPTVAQVAAASPATTIARAQAPAAPSPPPTRKMWRSALVNPERPLDKEGNPNGIIDPRDGRYVPNPEGLRELCARIAGYDHAKPTGKAPVELVSFNQGKADKLAELYEAKLAEVVGPMVVSYCKVVPIAGGRR